MSVDGFSMSSLGLPKDITSAQMAASTEQAVLNAGEKVVGKIDKVLNKRIDNNTDEEKEKISSLKTVFKKMKKMKTKKMKKTLNLSHF